MTPLEELMQSIAYKARRDKLAREMTHKVPYGSGEVTKKGLADLKSAPGKLAQGLFTGMAGGPVDIANLVLKPFGLGSERPIMGSDHLASLISADTNSLAYKAGTVLPFSPSGIAVGGAKVAAFGAPLLAALGATAIGSKVNQGAKLSKLARAFPGQQGIFAGVGAKTANLDNLGLAEKMKALSAPAKTKYQLAHEVAQRNAAKPISEGGLGLPADNMALDRAKAMGFDTPAYHGTDADIQSFDNKFLGSSTLSNTDSKWAQNLAKKGHWFSSHDLSLPADGRPGMFTNVTYPVLIPNAKRKYSSLDAAEKGRSLPSVSEVADEEFKGTTSYIVPNPSNIRSRFAAFDPARRHEADILGNIDQQLLKILGGASAAGLLGAGGYSAMKDK